MFTKHLITGLVSVPTLIVVRRLATMVPWSKTGFFCDDDEIRHPRVEETVSANFMFMSFSIIAVLLVLVTETSLVRHLSVRGRRVHRLPGHLLPPVLETVLYVVSVMACGDLATSALTSVGKRTMSRPRPNFLSVCQPNLTALCPPGATHTFVTEYECLGEMRQDEYFSFPSGHSSHSTYYAVFLIMYLHKRCRVLEPLRALAQLALTLFTFFICTSRVRDFKHRLSDVAGGALLGTLMAVFFVTHVLNFFRHARYHTSDQRGYEYVGTQSPPVVVVSDGKRVVSPTSEYGSVDVDTE